MKRDNKKVMPWLFWIRSHLVRTSLVLFLTAAILAAGLVLQPWFGGQVDEEITAEQLRSGAKAGFLHRSVDRPAVPFTLTDQNGKTVSLQDFRGKWVVMDWIYISCVDACPALTANMKMLQAGFSERVARQVQLVSITFDPGRDTPQAMKAYAQNVNGDIPGWSWLTGSKEQTDAVAEAYGVSFALAPSDGHDHEHEDFDHTVLVVVIDPQGRERYRYFGVGWSQDLLERLEAQIASSLLKNSSTLPSTGDEKKDKTSGPISGETDLKALSAQATIFTWEEWELPYNVTSVNLYQYPKVDLAATHFQEQISQVVAQDWKKHTTVEVSFHYTILNQGAKNWQALGIKQNFVVEIKGKGLQPIYEAIGQFGSEICCF